MLIRLLICALPWSIKRRVLQLVYKYDLHPRAHIGLSFVFPRHLVMREGARIGHLNVVINLDEVVMHEGASLGRSNWVTGFPTGTKSQHFGHRPERRPQLVMGRECAVTKNHHLDCTDAVHLGPFTTMAGYRSQILSHSIDIATNRQDCAPVSVGAYCFLGTSSTLIAGSKLPDYSVLGAKSLLNRVHADKFFLYGGVPAVPVRELPHDAAYFHRSRGFVV